MRFFRLLWKLIEAYLNYRRQMKKIRSSGGRWNFADPALDAYRRGDYQGALQAGMGAGGCFDASLLMQLGRFAEAEQQFEQAVASEKQPKLSALAHVMFGELLLELRRYPQAQEHFDAAVSLWPERGATYRDIAELCLRRGDKPSDALRWARLAVETERAGAGVTPETKKANLSCDLATLAWAVAADSRDAAEVRRLYAEALTLSADNPVTSTAQMHCHFGQAYTALDDSAASSQQFEQAARVDPHGLWGRTAQTMATGVRQCQ